MNASTRIPARSLSLSISMLVAMTISLGSLESAAVRPHTATVSSTVHEFSAAATASAATGSDNIGWD